VKRVNIRDAFVGEPNAGQEGLSQEHNQGSEALLLAVRGGELTVVVPAGTDDGRAVQEAELIRGVLRLENERVVTFEIQADSTGAFYEDEPAELHRRRQASGGSGLSEIASSHDYMGDAAGAPGGAEARPRRAGDLMTADPITTRPDMPVREAAALMVYHRISGLPVLDGQGTLVGVVSEADIIDKPGETVNDVMTRDVISVAADSGLEDVASMMTRHRVKRVPVVQDGRLAGIISRADIVRWVAR